MAAKDKKDVEILLERVDIVPLSSSLVTGKRSVLVELVWPRMQVSSKTATRTLAFPKGVADFTGQPWHERILFKESVERRFALAVRVYDTTISLKLEGLLRYTIGEVFGVTGGIVEDIVPGELGDIAASPMEYLKKQVRKDQAPEPVAEGYLDLETADLEGSSELEIELLATADSYRVSHRPGEKGPKAQKRIKYRSKGEVVGKAKLTLNVL